MPQKPNAPNGLTQQTTQHNKRLNATNSSMQQTTGHYLSIVAQSSIWLRWAVVFLRKSQHMNLLELSKQPNVLQQFRKLFKKS